MMTIPRLRSPLLLGIALALCGDVATLQPILLAQTQPKANASAKPDRSTGVFPTDAQGRPLNFGFETGTLDDWTAQGAAFAGQPVKGDRVHARRSDMRSRHAGEYWVGSFEISGDRPQGTLISVPFKATHPYATFLAAGGSHRETRVDLVLKKTQETIFSISGETAEDLTAVGVDLRKHQGKEIFIRLVDRRSDGWGHLNFDDFRFHDVMPDAPTRASSLDVYSHAGLDPEAAAKAMTAPPGFQVTLAAGEPDIKQPIAMAYDDRGRLWAAEAYSYPTRLPDDQAHDRILIFEDKDGDGKLETRKVFADHLNLISGIEVGFGGVWVGAAPYLMFIPDQNGDDKPDGPPRILLDGWAYQDTHETLNTFIWGPDGWLYGCHGVFTHSRVGKPGTPDAERVPINAGIWRYHPIKHRFEVFAHGTSNPWGVDFNDRGQAFLTSCVIPHLFHIIQNARYHRQAGPHFNPFTYDDIKTIADHLHYVGANPHGGNGRSDSAGGGHAHCGAMIYLGGAWPESYRDTMFVNNIHGARINNDALTAKGSGYVAGHRPDFLLGNDSWSQIVNFRYGPDGQVHFIDWYDRQQCHRPEPGVHDRGNGRIFKLSYGKPTKTEVDLRQLSDVELARLSLNPNDWRVRHSRRLLQERSAHPDPEARRALGEIAFKHADETRRLRGLWALHVYGGLDDAQIRQALQDASPYVRGWAIQLAMEDGAQAPKPALLERMAELAKSDSSPVVRLYLASAANRLPNASRWDVLEGLIRHGEDADDHNLPLVEWYAFEPLTRADPQRALKLAETSAIPRILAFATRRIASSGDADALALVVDALGRGRSVEARRTMLAEVRQALRGRRRVEMPAAWPKVFETLVKQGDAQSRSDAAALALLFGDRSAHQALMAVTLDAQAEPEARQGALQALLQTKPAGLPETLRRLLNDERLRASAIRGLAGYADDQAPAAILAVYSKLPASEKRDALNTLAARPSYAQALLNAVAAKRVASTDLSADIVRQLRNLKDSTIDAKIAEVWGTARESAADKVKLIADYKAKLTASQDKPADLALGRAMYVKTCQQCHTLFGVGAKIGPDLTGSNRADLDYILSNVLDPDALIGKDYVAHIVETSDGRVLTGLIREESAASLTLATANEVVVVPKAEIETRKPSASSMMPADLWKTLSDEQVRALVSYLASPSQTPILATPDTTAMLFNGRDLTGWQGAPGLWTVENGEIVGKTDGLDRNEFLRSEMAADDFRLTVKVKLVRNEGNSGIQFRSEAIADGEVKGYQADAGAGWWGKLYEEHGRGLLWDKSGESHIQPGEWNDYEIVAQGSRIRTFLNGKLCVDLDDPNGAKRGVFALQLHSGGRTEVRFKDLKLELLSKR